MISLGAENIVKKYQERTVLDLSCSFIAGSIHVLLGANGSGKSTFLRILGLLERPDSGTIHYAEDGCSLAADLSLRRRIVLVPDRNGLFRETVAANVAFGLKIRGRKPQEIEQKVRQSLERVGLWSLHRVNALTLSSGEAQRLCLAMALALDPDVILLDEPTANLDPGNAALVEKSILGLRRPGRLVLLVTHNLFQAQRLADRIFFIHQGRLLCDKEAGVFFADPGSDEARAYVRGEMVF